MATPHKRIVIGERFFRLVVVGRSRSKSGSLLCDCLCDCGGTTRTAAANLRSGQTGSCGCYQKERSAAQKRTHGASSTKDFHAWEGMLNRCLNPNSDGWKYYGGRGISVCERWKEYANFLSDMGPRPKGLTLDRYPNNDGNYEPGNCRWATRSEQARNTRNALMVEAFGEVKPLADWCDQFGVSYSHAWKKIFECGLSFEAVLARRRLPAVQPGAGRSCACEKYQAAAAEIVEKRKAMKGGVR